MAAEPDAAVAEEIGELGFTLLQRRRDGALQYGRRTHVYMNWWLTAFPDGTAEMTWEFALGQYLRDKGLLVSGQDELSLLLFPVEEIRGPLEPGWASSAAETVEAQLAALDFAHGT